MKIGVIHVPVFSLHLFVWSSLPNSQSVSIDCKRSFESLNAFYFLNCLRVFDRGTATDFNYIAITLAGRNFKFIRKACKDGKLSLACGLSAGMQCLKALEELHKVGFVHRSVNPSTFAIGRVINGDPKDLRNVYILDFGLAHQYREADGTHKPPRQKPSKYIGKARYAPRNAYLNRELSRMDDLEMWLYVIVELVKGAVPWVHQRVSYSCYYHCNNDLRM
ncbi:hypothetical protein OSTOST_05063 [Ostertagia ostertagi]